MRKLNDFLNMARKTTGGAPFHKLWYLFHSWESIAHRRALKDTLTVSWAVLFDRAVILDVSSVMKMKHAMSKVNNNNECVQGVCQISTGNAPVSRPCCAGEGEL